MKINKTYRSLLDKSISSMLSAIEIYNKPNFAYREESFAILSVNAWELLLKGYLLRLNNYKPNSIYKLEFALKKDGTLSKRKIPSLNRCGNPKSLSIIDVLKLLESKQELPINLKESIESLIELRDNSVHFVNTNSITKQVQELGFANIKNYIAVIRRWNLDIDLTNYNFYLMPLAYVDAKIEVESILTSETQNYLNLIKAKIELEDKTDTDFDIAISIDIDFKKGNSFESIGVRYDSDGIAVTLSEEDIRKKFPIKYDDLTKKCRERYSNFKQNKDFNTIMKHIKNNNKLHHSRRLDPDNPKSQVKPFFNSNVWKELDKHYSKK